MKTISFFAAGIPKGQPRPRAFARKFGDRYAARVFDSGSAEAWKSQIAIAAREFIPTEPMTGPLALRVDFLMPRPKSHHRSDGALKDAAPINHTTKPDADNAAKAVMDTLTTLRFWGDDAQISTLFITKQYGATPGCSITIKEQIEERLI